MQIGREHFPGAVHQIVCFIHEETIFASVLGEVPTQINLRIKNVVVIADDGVGPNRDVQREFERTNLVFLGHGFKGRAGDFFLVPALPGSRV